MFTHLKHSVGVKALNIEQTTHSAEQCSLDNMKLMTRKCIKIRKSSFKLLNPLLDFLQMNCRPVKISQFIYFFSDHLYENILQY